MRIPGLAEATPVRQSGRVVARPIPPPARVDVHEPPAAAAADDAQLRVWMTGYQAGRLDGFEALYAAVASHLRRYLVMLTRDGAIADDLLQESFLQVHRFRHTYDAGQPLRPWLFAIARHVFLMHARATRRRLARVGPLPDDVEVPVAAEVEGLADRIRVRAALDLIGHERREALLLHHVWGFSFREIGGVLGITEAAAKLRSSRGMADLRDVLAGSGRERVNE
jgi:RNA polymerase sigma-70 factor (ECF subfamily)